MDLLLKFDGHGQRLARTSARCRVRIVDPARDRAPWICMRQLGSRDTTARAPVLWIASILVRAMAPDTSANLTEKVPPKPQHSSAGIISRNSSPRTFASKRLGAL